MQSGQITYYLWRIPLAAVLTYGAHLFLTRGLNRPLYESIAVVIIISLNVIAATVAGSMLTANNAKPISELIGLFKSSPKLRTELNRLLGIGSFAHFVSTFGVVGGVLLIYNDNILLGGLSLLLSLGGIYVFYKCLNKFTSITKED